MNSFYAKTCLLSYFRFKRQFPYVLTEFGRWNADVFACNDQKAIEVEVKISIADLKREAVYKKNKHLWYKKETDSPSLYTPNEFYVAVPQELKEKAEPIIKDLNPNYGLICINAGEEGEHSGPYQDKVFIMSRAKPLHDRAPKPKIFLDAAKRMSSMIATFYQGDMKRVVFYDEIAQFIQNHEACDEIKSSAEIKENV